jgi:hypothetical protein
MLAYNQLTHPRDFDLDRVVGEVCPFFIGTVRFLLT